MIRGKGPGHRYLLGAEQRDGAQADPPRRHGRELGVEVRRGREDAADHALGLQAVAGDDLAHEPLGRGEDVSGIVAIDGDRAAQGEQAHGRGILAGPRARRPIPGRVPPAGGLVQARRTSAGVERRCAPSPRRVEPQRPERDALEALHRVADGGAHALDLALAPLVDAQLDLVGADPARPRAGAVGRPRARTPARRRVQRALATGAPRRSPGRSCADLVARVAEAVRQLAVVGQQDQPGHVGVQAPDRVQARVGGHELGDRRAALGVARRRDDARRLVERVDDARLGAPRRPPSTATASPSRTSRAGSVTTSPPTVTRPRR